MRSTWLHPLVTTRPNKGRAEGKYSRLDEESFQISSKPPASKNLSAANRISRKSLTCGVPEVRRLRRRGKYKGDDMGPEAGKEGDLNH